MLDIPTAGAAAFHSHMCNMTPETSHRATGDYSKVVKLVWQLK